MFFASDMEPPGNVSTFIGPGDSKYFGSEGAEFLDVCYDITCNKDGYEFHTDLVPFAVYKDFLANNFLC